MEITDRTIRISWNTPTDTNGIIVSYRLRQCLFNTTVCSNWQTYSNTTFSGLLSSLQPNTNYLMQLAASTRVGFGGSFQQSITTAQPISKFTAQSYGLLRILCDFICNGRFLFKFVLTPNFVRSTRSSW